MSTKVVCLPEKWISHTNRMKVNGENVKTFNYFLDTLERKAHDARHSLIEHDIPITSTAIKNIVTGRVRNSKKVLEVFQIHDDQMAALDGKEYELTTLGKFKISIKHSQSFIQWKYSC